MSTSERQTGVLIIEEDRDILEALSEIFEAEGFEVAAAFNDKEGLKELQRLSSHCVVLRDLRPMRNLEDILGMVAQRPSGGWPPPVVLTCGRLGWSITLTRQWVDLRPRCQSVLEAMRESLPTGKLRLQVEGDLLGRWDAERLAQLVSHLVMNALGYSPEDQPVTVTLRAEGAWVRLEVHHLGAFLEPRVLLELMKPFPQGLPEEEAQSAGLGLRLFIVRLIVLAYRGTLDVRSTPEEGTTFTVLLPRVVLAEA